MQPSLTKCNRRQTGTAAVEFAFVCCLFFSLIVFGMIELSRAFFVWTTMTEVTNRTARAASKTNFADNAAINALRSKAMLSPSGKLPLGGGIDDSYLRIDYLNNARTAIATLPSCPPENMVKCLEDPNGESCIRFVRVRLCQPGTDCDRVEYHALVSLIPLNVTMPTFAAVAPAESLGMPATCP